MKIQLNTDSHISGREDIAARIEQIVDGVLARWRDQVTRIEVHLSDINSDKGGVDKKCVLEVRLENRPPIAASAEAEELYVAVKRAAEKLDKALDSDIGRVERRSRESLRTPRGAGM
jgi:ribosomal subunit interface protein